MRWAAEHTPSRVRGARRRRGFTLVEILTVVFIVGILVALVVGVSGLIRNQAAEEETRTTQKLVLQAIKAYRGDTGSWPAGPSPQNLLTQLQDSHAAVENLRNLPPDALPADGDAVLDAYGNAMNYQPSGALGSGGPVLISAGPDGDFGTSEDNIRSDEQ